MPTDYPLYSNYERLVDALLAGEVDIAWNTNTAYVAAEDRIGGEAQLLGMRDVDGGSARCSLRGAARRSTPPPR